MTAVKRNGTTFHQNYPEIKEFHAQIETETFDKDYIITGIPRYLLIDQKGKIVKVFISLVNQEIKSEIDHLLKIQTR